METTKKLSHLKMYGAGHASGGSYQNVSIKGKELSAKDFKANAAGYSARDFFSEMPRSTG